MKTQEFVDYYELLNCSPTDSLETIERMFRQLASEFSPESTDLDQRQKLAELVEGFQILRDPRRRSEYDQELRRQTAVVETTPSIMAATSSMNDTEERAKILEVLCARRRTNMKNPGLPLSSVVEMLGCDEQAIEFHLWYFLQKGWVQREESGVLSITASGVDRIDEMNLARGQSR